MLEWGWQVGLPGSAGLGVGIVPDRLVVDLTGDGQAVVLSWPNSGLPVEVSRARLEWPLNADELEDLRWYLEDYLLAPFGVWEDRGPAVRGKLAGWGEQVFRSVFGVFPSRDAYQRARDKGLEVAFRSEIPDLLGLPWELMRDPAGPVALGAGGISRSLPLTDGTQALEVPGGRLRVLMVISRPAGTNDVGYQMVARPLLERLEAVRGEVELTVLRPPTFRALREAVLQAADAGQPFHVVHFDGHGAMPGRDDGGMIEVRPGMSPGAGEGVLAFELPGGGNGYVAASRVAAALAAGRVPVAVLNACQSGTMGKELEASVATALLKAGCAAVVAMAYSVYAVAAAEFMAAFYESLFAGDSVGTAVGVGRRRLFERDGRPSPKGDLPLADWLVPVCYLGRELRLPQARASRPATAPSLDAALDQIRAAPTEEAAVARDPLAAVDVFVGRDDLFYHLETAARLQHVVVLAGPGGTGKTQLAKGFARWQRDTGGIDDPRLAFWHSFEPGVASFGLDGVLTAIGLGVFGADFARLEAPQRLEAVKQLLAQYRALLVWDNFESVREMPDSDGATPPLDEAGCTALKDFLEWVRDHSRSTVIITSRTREDWLGQVRRVEVGGLNQAEAAQYAGYLLAPFPAARERRERRSFGELLEWLEGHPLAMRLTLPRLDTIDPADLLAGLRGTVPLPGGDAEEARLSSLGACITYSFAHLSEQTTRLLPALSLFQGTADAALLAAFSARETVPGRFAGIGPEEWMAVLQDAARVGLLTEIGTGMYRIHPALPGYLAAEWQAGNPSGYNPERDACEQALCTASAIFSEWVTSQIESSNAGLAYAMIGLHRRTLGAMLGRALDHRAWPEAEGIARALDPYLDNRGLSEEANAWADRILAAIAYSDQAPAEPARSLWLYTTIIRATRQNDAGQPDQADETYRQALAFLQGQPETEWTKGNIAVICHQLGNTAKDRGRLDEAEDWYRKALAINEELGNRPNVAKNYHQLGYTAEDRGRLDEAEDWYRRALAVKEELGDRPGMVGTYHQLGNAAHRGGRLEEAEDWYRRALAIFAELGDRPGMAGIYHQLGITAQDRHRLDEAEDWCRKSLVIKEELGNRHGMATTYDLLGRIARDRGRLEEAEDWCCKAIAIFVELGDRPGMAFMYHQLGITVQDQGRLEEAEDWYRKALAIFTELGDRPGMARNFHRLGGTAFRRGRSEEAEDWFRQALLIEEELGALPGMAMSFAELGVLAGFRQQPHQALDWLVRSVALFDQFPHPSTGPAPSLMARFARQLGMPALEEAWLQVTGQPVPQPVRDYITSHHDEPGESP
jgi:tetratricopeptide (TPR) repeat protein